VKIGRLLGVPRFLRSKVGHAGRVFGQHPSGVYASSKTSAFPANGQRNRPVDIIGREKRDSDAKAKQDLRP
jgi:hypothetical protein